MRELQINAASRVERSTRAESESRTRLQNIAALAEHLLQETKGALSDLDRTHHQSISDYQVGMGALKDVHDMISSRVVDSLLSAKMVFAFDPTDLR